MAKRPMLTMMVAQQADPAAGPTAEVPLDVLIQDIRGEAYLALRAGESSVLLTECEAEALTSAIGKLSIFATALCSARDHIQNAPPEDNE
jgi:hypothetical protein